MSGVLVPGVPRARVHSGKSGVLPTAHRTLCVPLGLMVWVPRSLSEHKGSRDNGIGVVCFTLDNKLTVEEQRKNGQEFVFVSFYVPEGIDINLVNVIRIKKNSSINKRM